MTWTTWAPLGLASMIVPGGHQVHAAGGGGASHENADFFLAFHGYSVASLLVLLGTSAHQVSMAEVVGHAVEVAGHPGPGPAVGVRLEPDLVLAVVHADGESGEPRGMDVGPVFAQRRNLSPPPDKPESRPGVLAT